MENEEEDVSFEVGRRDDGRLWTLAVTCTTELDEQEFAAAMLTLAQDILDGKVTFDGAPEVSSN